MNSPKVVPYAVVHGSRKDFSYNLNGTAGNQAVKLCDLGTGALVLKATGAIGAAFNAGTTNVAEIVAFNAAALLAANGNPLTATATYTWLATGTFVAGTAGATTKESNVNLKLTEDVEVYVRYLPTGTAPNAGAGTAFVSFYPHLEAEA